LECYRRSRDASIALIHRLFSFDRFLRLFADLIEHQDKTAREVFQTFKDRWGLEAVFQELGVIEAGVHNKSGEEQFALFRSALEAAGAENLAVVLPSPPSIPSAREKRPVERPDKTLRDRIEEAREDPRIPRQVMEVIDKNKLNLIGHSGSKYSELIETLLAIPWGKIVEIGVTAAAFEEGLNRTHFGLQRPKEILCDFFTNLIWRYGHFEKSKPTGWMGNGSAFLLVGPPGVGKTSLAISVARNLRIPYHKLSLGGMRDEADIRGHGFTYEGSKPGAIVQGLIKMGAMNGLFVLDEADKTEKFAIATLLEILDPEQNHLFHDKYAETTVDIDLSNCHFFLTANTLETVPPVVVNRCEVVVLDRYSVEEKIAIAQDYLIRRVRGKYQIESKDVFFDPGQEPALIRYLIQNYTYEAGVRELERVIRTLFLRIQRKELLTRKEPLAGGVRITREKIKATLKEPTRPRRINDADRTGEMLGLGVDVERGVGSIIPVQAASISVRRPAGEVRRGPLSIVHATGNIEKVMDESRKVATTGILACAAELGIDLDRLDEQVHLHFMGGSTRKDGPSAGGAIALALASLFAGRIVRRDVAMTGEIDIKGRITGVGGLAAKLETACNAGCSTVIIPRDNLVGDEGVERFPDALKQELQILSYEEWLGPHAPFDYQHHILQVVAVDHIVQAARIAFVNEGELAALETIFVDDAKETAEEILRAGREGRPFLQAIQVKGVDELAHPLPEFSLRDSGAGLTLLIRPELREAISALWERAKQPPQLRDFDPNQEKLSEVLQEILTARDEDGSPMPRLSLVAPFYFLKRDGIGPGAFPVGVCHEGIKIFANNYTVQG
ncbi:MAG: AAA family ATPase, partial [Syntrophobacteraceae bacterium]|nr:AAA family ATPase [Syntrophobacteraceae bacterium]